MFTLLKKNISKLFFAIWMVFSVGYISWSLWNTVRASIETRAYGQGVADAVNQLIQAAETGNCQPIPIYNKDQGKEVKLINITCLTKSK